MKKTALMIWGNPRRLFLAVYGICHLLPWRKRPHLPKVFNPVEAELMDFQGTCFSPWFLFPSLSPVAWLITEFNSLQLTVKFTTVLKKSSEAG